MIRDKMTVLVAVMVKVITWPTWSLLTVSSVLVIPRVLVWLAGTVSGAQAWVAPVALAQAVSSNEPALRSARVTACVPVQTIVPFGAMAEPLDRERAV